MILLLDGTIGSDISVFLTRLYEDTPPCTIMLYDEWLAKHSNHSHSNCSGHHAQQPEGIIYLRVMPEIAFARLQKRARPEEIALTLDYIQQIYQQKEELFIHNKNSPSELHQLPLLVLNGNIDFQTDFAQFYNHLFYIKRLLIQIQEKKDMLLGVYKPKVHQRQCC